MFQINAELTRPLLEASFILEADDKLFDTSVYLNTLYTIEYRYINNFRNMSLTRYCHRSKMLSLAC